MDGSDDEQPLHPAIRGLKTVCRCNNIKYRTIERAIRDGAMTVSQVAARTGATTGHCGGSCTPDIQEMIASVAAESNAAKKPAAAPGEQPVNAWWVRTK